ncbi:hypothetical protein P9J64_01735 [Deltaproteobacteria bacterium IMCC39524]|nr:hypothetical protein [Deltaproteobacteria bacterium IMCC39524]
MSSILKALRKIEEEKRVASHAAPDLRMDQGLAEPKPRPLLPLIAGVALGSVCVGFFFLWSSSSFTEVASQPQRQLQADAQVLVVGSNQAEQPVIVLEEKSPVTPLSASPAPVVREKTPEIVVETSKVPEIILPAEPVPAFFNTPEPIKTLEPPIAFEAQAKAKAPKVVKEAPKESMTSTSASKPESLPVKARPLPVGASLKVTEVFYQDDPANSMAVVNDLPVMIGTFVDSAVVLEIRSDKVVFKIGDDSYDVPVTPPQ